MSATKPVRTAVKSTQSASRPTSTSQTRPTSSSQSRTSVSRPSTNQSSSPSTSRPTSSSVNQTVKSRPTTSSRPSSSTVKPPSSPTKSIKQSSSISSPKAVKQPTKQSDNESVNLSEDAPLDHLTDNEMNRLFDLLGLSKEQRTEMEQAFGTQSTTQSTKQPISQSINQSPLEPVPLTIEIIDQRIFAAQNVDNGTLEKDAQPLLTHLFLDGLDLSSIDELSNHPIKQTLTHLYVQRNSIQTVNQSISQLANLEFLVLANNSIGEFPDFSQCQKLRYVNLSGNQITDQSIHAQHLPPSIQSLDLRDNPLTTQSVSQPVNEGDSQSSSQTTIQLCCQQMILDTCPRLTMLNGIRVRTIEETDDDDDDESDEETEETDDDSNDQSVEQSTQIQQPSQSLTHHPPDRPSMLIDDDLIARYHSLGISAPANRPINHSGNHADMYDLDDDEFDAMPVDQLIRRPVNVSADPVGKHEEETKQQLDYDDDYEDDTI